MLDVAALMGNIYVVNALAASVSCVLILSYTVKFYHRAKYRCIKMSKQNIFYTYFLCNSI